MRKNQLTGLSLSLDVWLNLEIEPKPNISFLIVSLLALHSAVSLSGIPAGS